LGLAQKISGRFSLSETMHQRASALMHPGSTLVITDQPSHQDTRTGAALPSISMT
jgi:hypothetical protein